MSSSVISLYCHPHILCYSKTLMSLVYSYLFVIIMKLSAPVFTTYSFVILESRSLISLLKLSHHDSLCKSKLWYH